MITPILKKISPLKMFFKLKTFYRNWLKWLWVLWNLPWRWALLRGRNEKHSRLRHGPGTFTHPNCQPSQLLTTLDVSLWIWIFWVSRKCGRNCKQQLWSSFYYSPVREASRELANFFLKHILAYIDSSSPAPVSTVV